MYSPREKIHNCMWFFKIGDADDQSSVPHAHSKEEGYRLNAWTGEIYPAGSERKNTICQLSRKELSKLHKDKDFLYFAKKQIEWYQSEYPDIRFYVPEWFELKYLTTKEIVVKKEENTGVYIFIGEAHFK